MAHPISPLGAIHTLISLVPLVAGLHGFVRHRRIDPATRAGQIYLGGLVVSVLTSFGLSSTGKFNAGHALGIVALLTIGGALSASRLSILGRARPYLSQFGFSFSFFLLLIPGINETLTRLPVSHPLAEGPESPIVRGTLAAWVGVFLLGALLQVLWTRSRHKRAVDKRA